MYIINRIAPNTEPWGTSYLISKLFPNTLLILTLWVLLTKQYLNHLCANPQTPQKDTKINSVYSFLNICKKTSNFTSII